MNTFIENNVKIIEAFLKRYPDLKNMKECSQIHTEYNKVRFTFNNEFYIYAYLNNNSLIVESEYGDILFEESKGE